MTDIDEMYDRILNIVEKVDSSVLIVGSEGSDVVTIGSNPDVPQYIEVEFNGEVPDGINTELLQAVNGTGWEYIDEDDVFNGDNSRGGLITITREIDPDDARVLDEYERRDEL